MKIENLQEVLETLKEYLAFEAIPAVGNGDSCSAVWQGTSAASLWSVAQSGRRGNYYNNYYLASDGDIQLWRRSTISGSRWEQRFLIIIPKSAFGDIDIPVRNFSDVLWQWRKMLANQALPSRALGRVSRLLGKFYDQVMAAA